MKNKIELKKCLIILFITTIFLTIIFMRINKYEYDTYRNNYNKKIIEMLNIIKEEYPNIEEHTLIEILNKEQTKNEITLNKYGINLNEDDIILENQNKYKQFTELNIIFLISSFIILIIIFLIYLYNKSKKLNEIINLIEKINKKDYSLDIDNTEDELSILKNELYKTTIMLKEQAENSINDKINLKESLSDISHQLKTPLTSIMISLDNIIDNPNMDEKTKKEFIHNIKRETMNIKFLVNSILKLSKLDTNTIEFKNDKILLSEIINKSINNVSMISDLKNIKINWCTNNEEFIYCDLNWQIEAISNILKNSLDYSNNDSEINIITKSNKLYSTIIIEDKGKGINEKDLPNIFKRFYKGSNASNDSIGIGLALSKSIIEKNNGTIIAESKEGEGTRFIIKYYKN